MLDEHPGSSVLSMQKVDIRCNKYFAGVRQAPAAERAMALFLVKASFP
jgi:hypothetical protein